MPSPNKTKSRSSRNGVDTCSILVHGVPKALRQRFRETCVRRGVPMRRAVMDLMERYINKR